MVANILATEAADSLRMQRLVTDAIAVGGTDFSPTTAWLVAEVLSIGERHPPRSP